MRPRVRTATLSSRKTGDDHALGELEHETELQGLREVAVEDLPLVLDVDALEAIP